MKPTGPEIGFGREDYFCDLGMRVGLCRYGFVFSGLVCVGLVFETPNSSAPPRTLNGSVVRPIGLGIR